MSSWQKTLQSTIGRYAVIHARLWQHSHHAIQKYGNVAFDSTQKAVLTSCVLRYKPLLPASGATTPARNKDAQPPPDEEGFMSCCFSFTIRRDPYGIPTLIVGNFIKC